MAGDVTVGYLKSLSKTSDGNEGHLIAGQDYWDVYITGGSITGVTVDALVYQEVSNNTNDYDILSSQQAVFFTNYGASGTINFNLPDAPSEFKALEYSFLVKENYTLKITAPTGATIRNGADVTADGGTLSSNTIGNMVRLLLISSSEWVVLNMTGLWDTDT